MHEHPAHFSADGDRRMNWVLGGIVAAQLLVIVPLLAFTGAGAAIVAAAIAVITVATVVNVYVLTRLFWRPIERDWPARPALPGAVMRSFQSIWFGTFAQFTGCVHIAVDEQCLHVTPMAPMRWVGARTISIPLDAITDVRQSFVPGVMRARLGRRHISGPAWCLRLAA
jgi:hypothetical protein